MCVCVCVTGPVCLSVYEWPCVSVSVKGHACVCVCVMDRVGVSVTGPVHVSFSPGTKRKSAASR